MESSSAASAALMGYEGVGVVVGGSVVVGGRGGGWDGALSWAAAATAAKEAEGAKSGEGAKGEAKGTTGGRPWNAVRGSVPPSRTRLDDDCGECDDAGESGECDWGEGRSSEGNVCRESGPSDESGWLAARWATREVDVADAAVAAGPVRTARAAAEEGAAATGWGAGRGAGPSHMGSFHSERCTGRRLVRGCEAAAMKAAGEPPSVGRNGEAMIGIIVLMGAPRMAVATARVAGA